MKKITHILLVVLLSASFSGQQLAANQPVPGKPHLCITPEGTVYNSQTYTYDPQRGVHLRPQFARMNAEQRKAAIQGPTETSGKVRYKGNHQLGLGPARWVTPRQLAQLHDREREILKRKKNFRSRWSTAALAASRSYSSPRTNATYTSSCNPAKLRSLIIGATVHISQSDGVGSGVITMIKGRKYILTANHVIKGTRIARVTSLKDGSSGLVNRTSGWHEGHDIAAIALPASMQHLPAVPLYRGQLPVGQPVYLSGFPCGHYNVTAGVVTGYSPGGTKMLHSANGPPGSSGGMLITPSGYLCGIHTAFFLPGSVFYPNQLATPSSVVVGLINAYGR